MSFCPKCGVQIDDNVTFCPSCGNSIQAKPVSNSTKVPNQENNHSKNMLENNASVIKIISIIAIVIGGYMTINGLLTINSDEFKLAKDLSNAFGVSSSKLNSYYFEIFAGVVIAIAGVVFYKKTNKK